MRRFLLCACLALLSVQWSHAQRTMSYADSDPNQNAEMIPAPLGSTPSDPGGVQIIYPVVPNGAVMDGQGCGSCGDCGLCDPWGPPRSIYGSAEYLFWSLRGSRVPPLVSSSPAGTPQGQVVLGGPGSVTLFGDTRINDDWESGFRVTAGFDRCGSGLVGSFFILDDPNDRFQQSSAGSPILVRPFITAGTGAGNAELVAFPNIVSGTVTVDASTELLGADVNLRENLCCDCRSSVDLLLGIRYLDLDDGLTIREDLVAGVGGLVQSGTTITVLDQFQATTRFYGGQIGLAGRFRRDSWWVDTVGKLALGVSDADLRVLGTTTRTVPGGSPVTTPVGLLAAPSNNGGQFPDRFAVVTDLQVRLGYKFNDQWSAFVGYTFLFWSTVYRAGEQIDLTVNTNQLATATVGTPARPQPMQNETYFWAQGVSVGVAFDW